MIYPGCPNCGHELPIGVFYREVGARRRSTFSLDAKFRLEQLRRDPLTGEDVPWKFMITCRQCGATSAVDTTPDGRFAVVFYSVFVLLLIVTGVLIHTDVLNGFVAFLFVLISLGAAGFVAKVLDAASAILFKVTLISTPDAERANESLAERRAQADRDMDVQIARLGPEYVQEVAPRPLEPELADVATRIDAAYSAATPSRSERPAYEQEEQRELERAKVVCAACGEMNQRDFEKCWNCEAALSTSG